MAEDGRAVGRRGWVQAAMAWFCGPQQEQHRWQQRVWPSEGRPESQPVEDATQRQAAMLAELRAADPARRAVPLLSTPQTPMPLTMAEAALASRLAIVQQALQEQQRRQQGGRS